MLLQKLEYIVSPRVLQRKENRMVYIVMEVCDVLQAITEGLLNTLVGI